MTRIFPTTSRSIVVELISIVVLSPIELLYWLMAIALSPSHPIVHGSNVAILSLVAPLPSYHYSSLLKEFFVAPKPCLFVLHTAYATHDGRS